MLGYEHPDFLKALLTPAQFAGWVEFFQAEPWGFVVDESRYMRIARMLASPETTNEQLATPRAVPDVAPGAEAPELPEHVAGDSMLQAFSKAFFRAEQTTPLKPGVHVAGDAPKP